MNVFVLSVPKSGTYLVAEVLKRLGFNFTYHVSTHDHFDPNQNLEEVRADPDKFSRKTELDEMVWQAKHNDVLVGHIPHQPEIVKLLRPWTKIFTHRNLRDVIVSSARYYSKIKATRMPEAFVERSLRFKAMPMGEEKLSLWFQMWGQEHAALAQAMLPWQNEKGVISARFEEMAGLRGESRQMKTFNAICEHVGKPQTPSQLSAIIADVLATKTVTSTGEYSDHRQVWTPHLEKLYHDYGFDKAEPTRRVIML